MPPFSPTPTSKTKSSQIHKAKIAEVWKDSGKRLIVTKMLKTSKAFELKGTLRQITAFRFKKESTNLLELQTSPKMLRLPPRLTHIMLRRLKSIVGELCRLELTQENPILYL